MNEKKIIEEIEQVLDDRTEEIINDSRKIERNLNKISNHQEISKMIEKLRTAKEMTEELGYRIEEVIESLVILKESNSYSLVLPEVRNENNSSFLSIIEEIGQALEDRIEEIIEDFKQKRSRYR